MSLRRSFVACCCALSFSAFAENLSLMPWPQQVEQPASGEKLRLTPQLTLNISGDHLAGAESRWLARIARQTGWPLLPAAQPVEHPTIRVVIARAVDPLLNRTAMKATSCRSTVTVCCSVQIPGSARCAVWKRCYS